MGRARRKEWEPSGAFWKVGGRGGWGRYFRLRLDADETKGDKCVAGKKKRSSSSQVVVWGGRRRSDGGSYGSGVKCA